jgi:acetoin utilization deacetylase AcuC-like enzyme
LPKLTQEENYIKTLGNAMEHIDAFFPQALVVALGLDAYGEDPFAGLSITTEGFRRIGAAIAQLKLPTLLVQEGGYLSKALGSNLNSFLDGFENG